MLNTKDRLLGYVKKRIMTDQGWQYFCEDCGDYHTIEHFYKNSSRPFGIFPTCNRLKENKEKSSRDYSMDYFRLNNVSEEDVLETLDLLERMGYDTCGSVHKQFMQKYFPNEIQDTKRHQDIGDNS